MKQSKGSIFRDKKTGSWIAKMQHNGKVKKRQGRTRKEAEKKLEDIRKEFKREDRLKKNELVLMENPEKISTAEVFRRFVKYKKNGRGAVSPSTAQRIESTIETHILPYVGYIPFVELTSREINDLIDDEFTI